MSPFYIEELYEGADSNNAVLIILNLDEGDGKVAIQTGEEVAFGSDDGSQNKRNSNKTRYMIFL